MTEGGNCLRFLGGGVIGFDIAEHDLRRVRELMGFALVGTAHRGSTVRYREATRGFERDDPLRDDAVEFVGSTIEQLVDDLHLTIALHATDDVFVHAGAVEWGGSAIVIPGRSHAGKSSLVRSLVRAGATYLSDEYARITFDGLIAPYPRPLQIREPRGRRLVDPESIGAVASIPVPPGLLLLTHYVEHSMFDPQPVAPAHAALALLDNTVIAEVHPARAAAAVADISRTGVARRSVRPGADHTVRAILALADQLVAAA